MPGRGKSNGGLRSAPWLGRESLVERVARVADGHGVLTIAAEAGSGKTTLLRQWLATRRPEDRVHVSDASSDAGLDAALAVLSSDGTTVVIDRAERLTGERLERLDDGASGRGAGTALIVAGRHDPQLRSADLELAGEDLAWSEPEIAEALERWGGPMSGADAESVAWLTEGWCVAVRLAAAAGAGVLREEAATLRHQLMRDAAATASPELITAAMRLAMLDQFDADTVDAMLEPAAGGKAMLDDLRRSRLFLRPLDEPGLWRFHRLFHQAARQELRSRPRAAAARWPRTDDA